MGDTLGGDHRSLFSSTVTAMTMAYVFSIALGHLPMLAVLVAGFVLIGMRRAHLSRRSVLMGYLGLGALVLAEVLSALWSVALPQIYASLDFTSSSFSMVSLSVNLVAALLSAVGIGLLIAAIVTRTHSPSAPHYR
jgi:hypothetical protein